MSALSDLPEIIYLDPRKLSLRTAEQRLPDLTVEGDRSYLEVRVRLAFPMSHPSEYVVLNDCKDEQIGTLKSLKGIDRESRRIIEEELDRRYFAPRITVIHRIREEYGCTHFDVETTRGPTKFGVRNVRENVRELSPGHVQVRDLHGSVYEVPDVSELDPQSQSRLSQIV